MGVDTSNTLYVTDGKAVGTAPRRRAAALPRLVGGNPALQHIDRHLQSRSRGAPQPVSVRVSGRQPSSRAFCWSGARRR